MKDLIGAYVEITSLECEAGYFESASTNYIGAVYISISGNITHANNFRIRIGYGTEEYTDSGGTTTTRIIQQANSVLIDTRPLSIGDKILFMFGDDLINENFANWFLTHTKPVLYNNKINRLQYNGKYVRNVNGKSVRNVNNKEVLPFYDIPDDTTIKATYVGETSELTKTLELEVHEAPVELYIDDILVGTWTEIGNKQISITKSFTNGQEYTFKLVGGKFAYSRVIYGIFEGEDLSDIDDFDLIEEKYGKNGVASMYYLNGTTIGGSALLGLSLDHKLVDNAYVKNLTAKLVNFDETPLEIPKCVKTLSQCSFLTTEGTKNIIPRTVIAFKVTATTKIFAPEIQFNHLETDTLFLKLGKQKSATAITIYHYGNPTVLNYDWAGANYTPTFVDLREQQ